MKKTDTKKAGESKLGRLVRCCENCKLSEWVAGNLMCDEDGFSQDPSATPDCFEPKQAKEKA